MPGVLRVVLFSISAYFLLLVLIRLLGKRTISKMNPSDLIVTVVLGSIGANLILLRDVPFLDGAAAFATILGLQLATEWATARWHGLRKLTDGSPVLLVYNGQMLGRNMLHENVDDEDISAALREHGVARLQDVQAVVLEIDGTLSVVAGKVPADDVLGDVRRSA